MAPVTDETGDLPEIEKPNGQKSREPKADQYERHIMARWVEVIENRRRKSFRSKLKGGCVSGKPEKPKRIDKNVLREKTCTLFTDREHKPYGPRPAGGRLCCLLLQICTKGIEARRRMGHHVK